MILALNKLELKLAQGGEKESATVVAEAEKQTLAYIDADGEHYFVAVISNRLDLNRVKFNVVSFNLDNFINDNLNVNASQLNQSFNLVIADVLPNKVKAMEYFMKIKNQPDLFLNALPEEFTLFVISKENFAQFIADKNIQDYLKFFNQYYK